MATCFCADRWKGDCMRWHPVTVHGSLVMYPNTRLSSVVIGSGTMRWHSVAQILMHCDLV
jgi:hypothetical protein